MNQETKGEARDINDHGHASRPGWISLVVLVTVVIAVIVWSLGGFG